MELPYEILTIKPNDDGLLKEDGQSDLAPANTWQARIQQDSKDGHDLPVRLSGEVCHCKLLQYLSKTIRSAHRIVDADTVVLMTDTHPLSKYGHWNHTGPLWEQRLRFTKQEKWFLLYLQVSNESGLELLHYTWGATFALPILMVLLPGKHFVLADHDAAPTLLWEVQDLCRFKDVVNFFNPYGTSKTIRMLVADRPQGSFWLAMWPLKSTLG